MESQYKNMAVELLDEMREETHELCTFIHEHPELGFHEFQSSEAIAVFLERHGFEVERGCAGMQTAFKAVYDSKAEGPVIGFLCEYDALPGIGHGCGHNVIGTASASAAVAAIPAVGQTGGKIVVLGTPAEEGSGGGKELLIRAGVMKELDCALMSHPGPQTCIKGSSLAIQALRFIFHGKAAHASATPEEGISALEAVIQLFNQINAMRTFLPANSRINGIITKGGTAPNIVPDLCEAVFNIRSDTKSKLEQLLDKAKRCGEASALATGCTLEIEPIGIPYDEIIPNDTLLDILERNMLLMGETIHLRERISPVASTDLGNVSQVLPAFQAMFRLGDGTVIPHSAEFAQACKGKLGSDLAYRVARVLAATAIDLLEYPELVEEAKEELKKKKTV